MHAVNQYGCKAGVFVSYACLSVPPRGNGHLRFYLQQSLPTSEF